MNNRSDILIALLVLALCLVGSVTIAQFVIGFVAELL
jgi:hypothetical protein